MECVDTRSLSFVLVGSECLIPYYLVRFRFMLNLFD